MIFNSNFIPDKPFKTYDELIKVLESRGMHVDDHDFAKLILQEYTYYELINGHKNVLCLQQNSLLEELYDKVTFSDLYSFSVFEHHLLNILFKYILRIETGLKSRISYRVSEQYGVITDLENKFCPNPNDYLSFKHYSNSNNARKNTLRALKEACSIDSYSCSSAAKHYIQSKNHIPPWILTTSLSFGLTIRWFSILKSKDKKYICDSYLESNNLCEQEKKEYIRKALELLKEYRNNTAHGRAIFTVTNLPQLPKNQILTLSLGQLAESEYDSNQGRCDIFAVILAIHSLLKDPFARIRFLSELNLILKPYIEMRFSDKTLCELLHIPNNILDRLAALRSS